MRSREALEERARRAARRSLHAFVLWTFPEYQTGWHHIALCNALEKWMTGEIPFLLVTMPPRHGKSELVSRRLPAYIHGIDRDAAILAASYSADLAGELCQDVANIIRSHEYQALFPLTRLARANNSGYRLEGSRGRYQCAGVLGGLTGFGSDKAIVDDPFKNAEEAASSAHRDKVWRWLTAVFRTRCNSSGSMLVTLTRWHQDDVGGRLLAEADANVDADQWMILDLPAVYDSARVLTDRHLRVDQRTTDGEPLWPAKFDRKALKALELALGPYLWQALYQQLPVPDTGGEFTRESLRVVESSSLPAFARRVRYWDTAATETRRSDYTVGVLMGVTADGYYYVLDVRRFRARPGDVLQRMKETAASDGPEVAVCIEVAIAAAGIVEKDMYIKELAGYNVIAVAAKGSKTGRARPLAAQAGQGRVLVVRASWTPTYIDELAVFPLGTHDDQVDASSGAFNELALGSSFYFK